MKNNLVDIIWKQHNKFQLKKMYYVIVICIFIHIVVIDKLFIFFEFQHLGNTQDLGGFILSI